MCRVHQKGSAHTHTVRTGIRLHEHLVGTPVAGDQALDLGSLQRISRLRLTVLAEHLIGQAPPQC
jgi:hypothetical protein